MKGFVPTILAFSICVAGCQSTRTNARSDRTMTGTGGNVALQRDDTGPPAERDGSGDAIAATTVPASGRNVHSGPSLQRTSFADDRPHKLNTLNIDNPTFKTHDPHSATGQTALTLDALESMAMANNPTLSQAAAQIRAARGAAYQAGLYPNPVVGYASDQIGVSGTAGEFQGGFVAQEFVTAGKLRISREKYAQRARIAETNLQAQQQRVLNDVRVAYYRALAAQRLVKIHQDLLVNGEDNIQTHKEMLNLGQTNQAGLLLAEVDLQRDRLNLKAARNHSERAWREMVALAGVPDIPRQPLADAFESGEGPLEWDTALRQLLSCSPDIIASWQKLRHDQIAVQRERVQPIPNILVDARLGRNFETSETVGAVSVGIPLPIFDRNRGTVRQAMADLSRSHAETRRLDLELRTRLAAQYRDYQTAWQRVEDYRKVMLPKAKQAYDLLHAGYKKRRAAWPEVLRAQRRHLDLQVENTNNLLSYRVADVAIRGMLLTGGLTEPAGPATGGHIDATPKPR